MNINIKIVNTGIKSPNLWQLDYENAFNKS